MKKKHMNTSQPKIWFNLTSSHGWNRPPVGIIRVEQNVYKQLRSLLGADRVVPCIWSDGRFVRLPETADPSIDPAVAKLSGMINSPPGFELSFNALYKLTKLIEQGSKSSVDAVAEDANAILNENRSSPGAGDTLITMGLDWDHPYKERLYELRTYQQLNIVTCCYDLIPAFYPQYCVGDVAKYFKEYFYNLGWGSDLVLCISQRSRDDFLKLMGELSIPLPETMVMELGDNIVGEVKPEKVAKDKDIAQKDEPLSDQIKRLLDNDYLLFVSTIERRKNHEVLYRAYHLLKRAGYTKLPRLVFVGMQGWGVDELLKDIELDPLLDGDVIRLNHVSDAELSHLYRNALFCVFPSLYEGWGLPVGEALAIGQFVICSDRGSLPEVGGDLVTYVDPWNAQAWADELIKYIENKELLAEAKARVKAHYKSRDWATSVQKISPAIMDLKAKCRSMSFQPGYAMSSFVGFSENGSIRSTGRAGYLMFGPHLALRPGKYKASMTVILRVGSPDLFELDICCQLGQKIIGVFDAPKSEKTQQRLSVEFELTHYVNDLEVRVKVPSNTDMSVEKVDVELLEALY